MQAFNVSDIIAGSVVSVNLQELNKDRKNLPKKIARKTIVFVIGLLVYFM